MSPFLWLLRASMLLALALFAERAARALRLRRVLLLGAATGALALPLLAFELPSIALALPSVSPEQVTEWIGTELSPSVPTAGADALQAGPATAARGLPQWGLLLWGLGSLLLAGRALAGRAWLAVVVRQAHPAPASWQLTHPSGPPVRISASMSGAGLAGPWPRAVLLPASSVSWSDAERAQVLRHEQAHAVARDDWGQLLLQVLTIALWPTPLAWWVQRRARLVAELSADAAVVGAGSAPTDYAETLARLASARSPGLVAASTRGMLETRVRALLAGRRPEARRAEVCAAAGASLLATVALAGVPGAAIGAPLAPAALQAAVDTELAQLAARWQPKDAAIVVVDADSGDVLASGDLHGALLDTPLELGSVLKPFTVAAALESGVPADIRLPGHGGRWSVGGVPIQDHRAAETLSLTELLAWSSNIGAAALVEEIGAQPVRDVLRAVGAADVPPIADHTAAAAHLGMGLGVSISPIQLAHAYTTFVGARSPFQPETVATVRAGLSAAIGPDGTAHAAATPGALGGKTGTARHGNGYTASFAGLWERPQGAAVVVIVVVEPSTERPYGGAVAAPAFARLTQP